MLSPEEVASQEGHSSALTQADAEERWHAHDVVATNGRSLNEYAGMMHERDAVRIIGSKTLRGPDNINCSCVYIYCDKCEKVNGNRCPAVERIIECTTQSATAFGLTLHENTPDGVQVFVIQTKGTHAGGESKQQVNKIRRGVKRYIANQPFGATEARRKYINEFSPDSKYLPTAHQITREKIETKIAQQGRVPGRSPDEMMALLSTLLRKPDDAQWQLWIGDVQQAEVIVDQRRIIVPFTCDYIVQSFGRYAIEGMRQHPHLCGYPTITQQSFSKISKMENLKIHKKVPTSVFMNFL